MLKKEGGEAGLASPPARGARTQERGRAGEVAGGLPCSRTAHTRGRGGPAGLTVLLARRSLKIHWFRAQVDRVIAGRAQ